MSTAITNAGEQLIAQKFSAGEVLNIDRIILANIPDLDLSQPVDREQGKPTPDKIVHEYVIPEDFKGFVNPNQVVYSMLLGSEVGNFQFNWLGLYSSADDVLIAVTHLPLTDKWQTDNVTNKLGNNLTRNFLLEFSGAKAVTNITVEAKTWQVDFTARLRGIDERERMSNRDIYGRSCFFNDGFKVVKNGSSYVLKAGAGYVEGIRCVLGVDQQLIISGLPKSVFLDVSLQQQGSDVVPVIEPAVTDSKADYTDENNARHYCVEVAKLSAAGVVTDTRRTEAVTTDLVEYLKGRTDTHAMRTDDPHQTMAKVAVEISKHTSRTDDPHKTMAKVNALKSSSITSNSISTIATSQAVKTVNDSLNTHKNANDPHGIVAKVKALLTSSTTSSSTTTFATPKAVKTVWDLIVGHKNDAEAHSAGIHGGCIWFDGAVNSAGRPIDVKTGLPDLNYGVCDGRTYTAPDGRMVSTVNAVDRFIVASGGEYIVGGTGGAKSVTLSMLQMPRHRHKAPTSGSRNGNASLPNQVDNSRSPDGDELAFYTDYSGSSYSHENRPPYIGLFLIKRL